MASPVATPCMGVTHLFFSSVLAEQEAAKKLCVQCPLRAKCLQRAFEVGADDGVWGGFDEIERRFYARLFGKNVGGAVRPLPKSLVDKLRRNRVMQTDGPPDEAMEA